MWNQIALDVPDDLKDAVIGEMSGDGIAGVWESPAVSGSTRLVAYYGHTCDTESFLSRIRDVFVRACGFVPTITHSVVEECDWTEEWKKSYTSFPVGNDFFVIPSWVHAPCPDDRIPIRIDPGQAFGTGTHETTQLTIAALERWVEPHQVVLDVGTGSGILAIASRLLGAKKVFACDIDPIAVQVAFANIARNQEPDIWTFCGSVDSVDYRSVHLLLANLTAELIMELLPEFSRILRPKGIAIFSGILYEQREDLVDACRKTAFTIHEEIARGEWVVLVTEKHGP